MYFYMLSLVHCVCRRIASAESSSIAAWDLTECRD